MDPDSPEADLSGVSSTGRSVTFRDPGTSQIFNAGWPGSGYSVLMLEFD